jgi:AraC family transcriptional regulator
MLEPSRVLTHGQFFGEYQRRIDVVGFTLATMRPDPTISVERHVHDTAHFILVLEGAYVTEAQDAPDCGDRQVSWRAHGG